MRWVYRENLVSWVDETTGVIVAQILDNGRVATVSNTFPLIQMLTGVKREYPTILDAQLDIEEEFIVWLVRQGYRLTP